MKKIFILVFITILSLFNISISAQTITDGNLDVSVEEKNICPNAKSAILFEGKTNSLLYEQDMNLRLPPASMTKIMTLLLIYEALEKNVVSMETVVTISEEAKSQEGSKAFLSVGEQITVEELIKCICIASANDAAVAMAETIYGSEEEFVIKMNSKVKELGLNNTYFSDCTGLSSKNHYTSAYDMAIISDYLLDKYPSVLEYTNLKEDYIRKDTNKPFWLVNTNKLLGKVDGINGLKTGYTSFSGYCITLHMEKNNLKLISVVMGYKDSKVRNGESVKLLQFGANNYKLETIVKKEDVIKSIDSLLYKTKINITVEEDVCVLVKKGEKINYNYIVNYELSDKFNGYIELYVNDNLIKKYPLVIKENLEKRNIFEITMYLFKKIFVC